MGRNRRRMESWRYGTVKAWLHRVQKFRREAKTVEEINAWDKVEVWMKTLLKDRYLNKHGAISIPEKEVLCQK